MSGNLDPNVVVAMQWLLAISLGWIVMIVGRRGVATNTSFVGSASARTAEALGTLVLWVSMIGLAGWLLYVGLVASHINLS